METTPEKRGRPRRLLFAAAAVAAAAVLLAVAVPLAILYAPLPELDFDAAPYLKGKAAALVSGSRVTAKLSVSRGEDGGFRVRAAGRLLDWPYTATADVSLGFIGVSGSASLALDGTDVRLVADFEARGARDWRFTALMPESRFSTGDKALGALVARIAPHSISNLACAGTLTVSACGECTRKRPVPTWSVNGSLRDVDVSMDVGGRPVRVDNLRTRFGANGIADSHGISPMFPRADCIEAAGVVLSNAFASIRATDRSYLVTEAGAECAGGELKLYALFLDPEKLTAGATIYVDGVDAGAVLSRVSGFRGEATGRLHGKLPFFLKGGRELRFKNAYLFSTPGEIGKVRIDDARPIMENLALGGVPEDVRGNLAKALGNLDYNVLRVELQRGEKGGDSALALKLRGWATHEKTTVPVSLDVTFRGDLDQIVNTGMRISRR